MQTKPSETGASHALRDIHALKSMLARIKADQQKHFEQTNHLLTPYDDQFWAITQAIADRLAAAHSALKEAK